MKAIFWVIESMIPFGNHPLFLALLGWMLPPKPAFMKLTTTPVVRAMTFTKQVNNKSQSNFAKKTKYSTSVGIREFQGSPLV